MRTVQSAAPITSRFLFVDVAAQRAKQLRRGALPGSHRAATRRPHKLERVAMEEVRQGVIHYTLPTVEEVHRGRGRRTTDAGQPSPSVPRGTSGSELPSDCAYSLEGGGRRVAARLPMIELGALLLFGVVDCARCSCFAAACHEGHLLGRPAAGPPGVLAARQSCCLPLLLLKLLFGGHHVSARRCRSRCSASDRRGAVALIFACSFPPIPLILLAALLWYFVRRRA